MGARLLQDGSARTFSCAYDQFHNYLLKYGIRGQLPLGHIYQKHIGPIDKLFLRLIGHGHSVLEVGIGDGNFIAACSGQGSVAVGLDVSNVALKAARRKHRDRHALSLVEGDARSLSFPDESFQFVVSKDLIEHLREEDITPHLREIRRVLSPGGRYLLWTPPAGIGHSSLGLHLKEYTMKELLDLLEKEGFTTELIPLHFTMLGRLPAIKPHSWALRFFLWLEALVFFLRLPRLVAKLPLTLRFALIPSACFAASKPLAPKWLASEEN